MPSRRASGAGGLGLRLLLRGLLFGRGAGAGWPPCAARSPAQRQQRRTGRREPRRATAASCPRRHGTTAMRSVAELSRVAALPRRLVAVRAGRWFESSASPEPTRWIRWPGSAPAGRVSGLSSTSSSRSMPVSSEIWASVSPSCTTQTPRSSAPSALRWSTPICTVVRRWRRSPSSSPPLVAIVSITSTKAATRATHGGHAGELVRACAPASAAGNGTRRGTAGSVVQRPERRRAAPRPPRRGRRRRRCCAPRRPGSRPGDPAASAGPSSSRLPPWAPTPGIRKIESGISSRRRARCSGAVAPDDRAHAAEAVPAREPGCPLGDELRQALVQGPPFDVRVLEVGRARVGGPHQAKTPAPRSAAASTSGSSASPPSSGLAVKASAPRPSTCPHGVAVPPTSACP